jgi:hypothetical protein
MLWWCGGVLVAGGLVESAPPRVIVSSAYCRLSACCSLMRTTLERHRHTQNLPCRCACQGVVASAGCRCVRRVSLRPPGVVASVGCHFCFTPHCMCHPAHDFFFYVGAGGGFLVVVKRWRCVVCCVWRGVWCGGLRWGHVIF